MWVALIVAAQTAVLAAYAASADARSSQGCIDVLTCCVRRFGLIGVAGVSGAFGPAWLASAVNGQWDLPTDEAVGRFKRQAALMSAR